MSAASPLIREAPPFKFRSQASLKDIQEKAHARRDHYLLEIELGLARAASAGCKLLPVFLGRWAEVEGGKMLAPFKVRTWWHMLGDPTRSAGDGLQAPSRTPRGPVLPRRLAAWETWGLGYIGYISGPQPYGARAGVGWGGCLPPDPLAYC